MSEPLPVNLTEEDANLFRQLMQDSQSSPPDIFSSSPSSLSAIPELDLASFTPSSSHSVASEHPITGSNIHSPQAVYPNAHSISATSSSFEFSLAAMASRGSTAGSSHSPLAPYSPTGSSFQNGPTPESFHFRPGVPPPGRGSLADLRRRIATPAPTVTPVPPTRLAIFVAFPHHGHEAQRNFLEEGVPLTTSTPSLSEVIRVLRGLDTTSGQVLNGICVRLRDIEFHVAWSRRMVEVRDDHTYSSVENGYVDVGRLRDHLQESSVILRAAESNNTSKNTFQTRGSAETPLFVVYIFQLEVRKI